MLLVLGRPGAGCTTLLKVLANRRRGYAEVTGDVRWGTLDPKQAEQFRGQITMNTEEEVFFPSLTVGQTIDFATRMKVWVLLCCVSNPRDKIEEDDHRLTCKAWAEGISNRAAGPIQPAFGCHISWRASETDP